MIYYGMPEERREGVLGTTDPEGRITSTDPVLAGKTMYFESSDGKYAGSSYIATAGGEVSLTLAETAKPEFPVASVACLVVIIGLVVIAWRFLKRRREWYLRLPKQFVLQFLVETELPPVQLR